MARAYGWRMTLLVAALPLAAFSGPAIAGPPASALSLQVDVQSGGRLVAVVMLRDGRGKPVADASVLLYQEATFGRLLIAALTTDEGGRASTTFASRRARTLTVTAVFSGGEGLPPAKITQALVLAPPERAVPVAGLTGPKPPPAFAALLVLVVGAVWGAYGYVTYLLLQTYRASRILRSRR